MQLLPGMFLVFVTLKLCDVIAWSWWLVTAPLWFSALMLFVVLIVAACKKPSSKMRRQ